MLSKEGCAPDMKQKSKCANHAAAKVVRTNLSEEEYARNTEHVKLCDAATQEGAKIM